MNLDGADKIPTDNPTTSRVSELSPLSVETEESWTDAECTTNSSKRTTNGELMEKVSRMVTELELIKVNMQCMLDQTLEIFAMLKERRQN